MTLKPAIAIAMPEQSPTEGHEPTGNSAPLARRWARYTTATGADRANRPSKAPKPPEGYLPLTGLPTRPSRAKSAGMDTERHNAQQREYRKRQRRRVELRRRAEATTDPDILRYRNEKARRAARH